ncbi:YybS family protein [Candidatus Formimonas warabiya]|uniref:DUF2232 domain-containing protein n=1 Tax=Formimonas warabiya TaxID=1761012 RepID=A0A3G1KUV2_FORW1|nr:DUF2232 domain-containing protein [Candidatus Formimonas warabiya]ATW26229.1 hypothetical protein DCMF_16975 [Candidatus Formimonas warabiya]
MKFEQSGSNLSVRALTEGALMAALSALIVIITIYIPFLGFLGLFIWGLPIIVLIVRHNIKVGVMGLIVTIAIVAIFAYPGLPLVLIFSGLTILFGYYFKYKLNPVKAILLGIIVNVFSFSASILITIFGLNFTFSQIILQPIQVLDQSLIIYKQSESLNRYLSLQGITFEQFRQTMLHQAEILIPGSFLFGCALFSLLIYLIAKSILKRLDYDVPFLPRFQDWHFPWYIVWALILGFGLKIIGDHFSNSLIQNISYNILSVLLAFYLVAGISFVVFYWKNYSPTLFSRMMIVFLLVFSGAFIGYLLAMIGVLDSLYDFRRLVKRKRED